MMGMVPHTPPTFVSEIVMSRRMRFKATAAVDQVTLTFRDIASSVVGVVAVTTTTSGILARTIRVKDASIWFTATTAGTPVEGVIDWNCNNAAGAVFSPGSSRSVYSTSVGEYSHLGSKPPKGSNQSFWHSGDDTTGAVTVTLPAGGILDFTVDYVVNDSNAVLAGASLTGATVGLWYHKQPDPNLIVMGNLTTIA